MTTTVDIQPELLKRAMERARASSRVEAIAKAVEEYTRADPAEVIKLLGTFDDFMTLEELIEMRSDDESPDGCSCVTNEWRGLGDGL